MTVSLTRMPADVLVVLDRSASMQGSTAADCLCTASTTGDGDGLLCDDPANCTNRWTVMKNALGQTIANAPDVHWGFELVPPPGQAGCSVSPTPAFPVGAGSAAVALGWLEAVVLGGNTPTAAAIRAATAYLSALANQHPKYILLATDGEPSCGDGQPTPTASDLEDTIAAITEAAAAGFPVYVLGVGPSASSLDRMAEAGGTGTHYPASSPDRLWAGIAAISRIVASCTFELPSAPPDPNNVAVYVDKQLIAKDLANGWTYGAATHSIELTGATCDRLKVAETITIHIFFGCPGSIPPICIP